MRGRPERRFLFRLCLALGLPHPDFLGRILTSAQLSDWEAFERLEPFGGIADDFRMGSLLNLVAGFFHSSDKPPLPGPLGAFPWHAQAANEPLVLDADGQVEAFDRIFANR